MPREPLQPALSFNKYISKLGSVTQYAVRRRCIPSSIA